MVRVITALITIYQRTLSPDTGFFRVFFPRGVCRHYPSCSEYTKQAVHLHGVKKGLLLGVKRVSRCHPFNPGGFDPVPGKK